MATGRDYSRGALERYCRMGPNYGIWSSGSEETFNSSGMTSSDLKRQIFVKRNLLRNDMLLICLNGCAVYG
jgi:hypothetical protein